MASLPRALAALLPINRPAASLAMLHGEPLACCSVIVALELYSSALRMYDRGGAPELTIRSVDLEALHLGTLSGNGGTALFLSGTRVGSVELWFHRHYGGDALAPYR